jgi:hypothetical protein
MEGRSGSWVPFDFAKRGDHLCGMPGNRYMEIGYIYLGGKGDWNWRTVGKVGVAELEEVAEWESDVR